MKRLYYTWDRSLWEYSWYHLIVHLNQFPFVSSNISSANHLQPKKGVVALRMIDVDFRKIAIKNLIRLSSIETSYHESTFHDPKARAILNYFRKRDNFDASWLQEQVNYLSWQFAIHGSHIIYFTFPLFLNWYPNSITG